MKTLHPGVHGGILARRDDAAHMDALQRHKLSLIDVVRMSGVESHNYEILQDSSKEGLVEE